MATELEAAAERLRESSITVMYPGRSLGHTQENDCRKLANFAAPLCDPTPITEGWLRSVGFDGVNDWLTLRTPGNAAISVQGMATWTYQGPDEWDDRHGGCGQAAIPEPKTRGQLRGLCHFLGIELKEQS